MTSEQFIYWIKGYMAAQVDCQIKTDVEKTITEIETGRVSLTLTRDSSPTTTHTAGRLDATYKDSVNTPKTLLTETRL
jgi:hypothetical protein